MKEKILYQINFPYGLGADRWIYEGWRDAFLDEDYQFFTLTERDDLEEILFKTKPNIFLVSLFSLLCYNRRKKITESFFKKIRQLGSKIFCEVAINFKEEEEYKELLKIISPFIDIFYSTFTPEIMSGFEAITKKPYYFLPHAANTKKFFPDKIYKEFECDLAFVGAKLPSKKNIFENVLYPLLKKYKVRIYGSSWTLTDRFLKLISSSSRKLGFSPAADFISKRRITISVEDERKLYSSAKICLNFHEYYKNGKVKGLSNEREFKILASGGFQISDYIPGMERYFQIGKEIIVAKNPKDWFEKIDYYLKNKKERKAIQENGTKRVLREHSYHSRVREIIKLSRAG